MMMRQWLVMLLIVWVSAAPGLAQDEDIAYVYTYHQASGSRVSAGMGTFPNVRAVDFALPGAAQWLLGGIDAESGEPRWRFLLADGSFYLTSGETTALPMALRFAPGAPITYAVDLFETYYPSVLDDSSPLTHPVFLGRPTPPDNFSLYIAQNGDVVSVSNELERTRLSLAALPDARPVISRGGQIAIYTGATDQRYVHGVLGDTFEAASLTILDADGADVTQVGQINLPGDEVFEGISPLWADVDGDGRDDLITTVSNGQGGARYQVFGSDGAVLAVGDPIGQPGRWRHQLAYANFSPDGTPELVGVTTPHIGGVVEFYRVDGGRLAVVASLAGYSSHALGSRNLDMAVAGDFNGDGILELVVPDQTQTRLAGIQRTADGAVEVWSLPLDGTLTSNLFALPLPDGRLTLAAATSANVLRVWLPN